MALRNEEKIEAKATEAKSTEAKATETKTLNDLENAMFPPPELDVAPRVKASQGALINNDGDELGDEIKGELVSYSYLYVISTNETDAEARKLTRYTYDLDRVVPDWDEPDNVLTADEYVQQLKDMGYQYAKIKKYIEAVVITDDDEIIVAQLSPQSVKMFNLFKLMVNKKIKDGKLTFDQATRVKITPKKKKLGKFNFTAMQFSLAD